ncbi:ATP-dependent helicase [Fusobacterium sp. IOR10]|uniref:ATP-dependent helicase n=1 Tax=Fusobacterium sp. IOR10 TaxID=2665157 RepID=UPI0013CF57A9|nr:ATP-dependent helicase [Fusobacterium sp. IOR10]
MKDVFSIFINDFSAKHINLYSNYRSAPCLVKIQQTIIKELEGQDALLPEPTNNCYKENDGICYAWAYENEESEAVHIADKIKELLNKDKIKPREICILVRNKPEKYTFRIIQKLIDEGIEARIEKEFQDLLTEPLIILMLDLFKLIIYKRSSNAWREVLDYLLNSIIISDDFYKNERKIEVELEHFIKECKNEIKLGINLNKIFVKTIKFLNIDKIKSIYPQYNQNDYWKNICNILYSKLNEYIENYSLADSIKRFEGENSIPIMTMHKSKGLEFHTVFFIGLEDSSLWNYKKNLNEETNGFFVAFSRAKEKIVFTFCRSRKKRAQNWSEIKRLYELLNSSGVILELIN